MTPWQEHWSKLDGTERAGGQGHGFEAERLDGTAERAFIKTLKKPRDMKARGRFQREVAAYKTVQHSGIPRLLDENSVGWEDRAVELFLAVEFVDGSTLREWVESPGHGPMTIAEAVAFAGAAAEIIGHCHAQGVLHRDLKPSNVMLRGDDPENPMIVDFGLSFNETSDAGDLTQIGDEEIGNRFLRLPEAWLNRTAVSDVTQMAGLFVYALTGKEPHTLQDQDGNMPHQRAADNEALKATLTMRQWQRAMLVFDRAFSTIATERYQSARDLKEAINGICAPEPDTSTPEGQMADFDEYLQHRSTQERAARASADMLKPYADRAQAVAETLAAEKGLELDASWRVHTPAIIGMALRPERAPGRQQSTFEFETRGSTDVALTINGSVVWRGTHPSDPELANAVRSELIGVFLRHYRDRPLEDASAS